MLAGNLIKTGEIGSGLRKLGTAWPDFPEIVKTVFCLVADFPEIVKTVFCLVADFPEIVKTPNSRWQTIYVR